MSQIINRPCQGQENDLDSRLSVLSTTKTTWAVDYPSLGQRESSQTVDYPSQGLEKRQKGASTQHAGGCRERDPNLSKARQGDSEGQTRNSY